MGPIPAINLLVKINNHQFGLGLVTIVLLRLVTVRDNLPPTMIVILINMYCSKKENIFFHIYVHAQ